MENEMRPDVLHREDPAGPAAPLVFDSPHSGLGFPDDFQPGIPLEDCERVSDWFVDELFAAAPAHGAVLIKALFRRAYIDPNRAETDLDTTIIDGDWPGPIIPTGKTRRGASLIWRYLDGETAIYHRKLAVAEVRSRIETYWRPYHTALSSALDEVHASFGRAYHVNCHSMQEMGELRWGDGGKRRADFVIGNRDGTTAGPDFTDVVVQSLRAAGYQVTVNDRFKGVELIRRHGAPASGRESLQIEVNRGLYMDEAAITKSSRFQQTRSDITQMIATLSNWARNRN